MKFLDGGVEGSRVISPKIVRVPLFPTLLVLFREPQKKKGKRVLLGNLGLKLGFKVSGCLGVEVCV